MTNSNENTLFAQKEQAPKHLTFSAGVKRLRSHWLSLKGRSTRKEYWLIGLCIYTLVGLALNIASIILFFILPGIRSNLITTPVALALIYMNFAPPRYRLLRLVCPFSLYTAHQPFLPLPYSKTICPGQ